jgi:alkylated DNA repair dioxygenase AlkB
MNAHRRLGVPASHEPLQTELFGGSATLPDGFAYRPEMLTDEEEAELVRQLAELPFKPFEFHGYLANRRVVGFGYRYDYGSRQVQDAPPMPAFLESLRAKAAAFAGRTTDAFQQILINEYRPGAGIGWHRDKPQFGEVVGVSLLSPCALRFRLRSGDGWKRTSLIAAPRSAYLLSGPARHDWEHSIPPVDRHRYSITFRTMAEAPS